MLNPLGLAPKMMYNKLTLLYLNKVLDFLEYNLQDQIPKRKITVRAPEDPSSINSANYRWPLGIYWHIKSDSWFKMLNNYLKEKNEFSIFHNIVVTK